jgi:heme o synthase
LETSSNTVSVQTSGISKIADIAQLAKLRLSSIVVFSSVAGYFLATDSINWISLLALVIGGFLVTGASNAINQVLEKDSDKLMDRTKNRPLPAERMSINEALIVAGLMGVIGLSILWIFLNPLSGILGTLALFLYTAIYTPLKRISPFAVFVGAFPGAIPPMLGWVAATGKFGVEPGLLFAVQFIWQFPHFWAIAWKLHDDYSKAGFFLLPSKNGKSKSSAFQIVIYSIFLIPVSITPWFFGITGMYSMMICILAGIWFLMHAIKLYITCSERDATILMFASFVYLPVVQLSYVFDKI